MLFGFQLTTIFYRPAVCKGEGDKTTWANQAYRVAEGVSGLIGAVKRHRYIIQYLLPIQPCSTLCYRPAESKEEGDMTTGANPAYGPHEKQAEIEEEYEIPQYTHQQSGAEGDYEGVYYEGVYSHNP